MKRRVFNGYLSTAIGSGLLTRNGLGWANTFEPTWESIETHRVPEWFDDAKLGIFIHWGLYSVPGWATPTGELGKVDWNKWFYQNPYAEWYLNSLRLKDTPTYRHHMETYGENFDYYSFSKNFNAGVKKWDPSQWARLFHDAGARYVVLTTKHHDGFTLWPSNVPNPNRPANMVPVSRDLVGDLTAAVREQRMHMGLYYSGGLDWTFEKQPIAKVGDLKSTAPQSQAYARYADAHWNELIRRYQTSVLWNDIGYPKLGKVKEMFAGYYNRLPEGVINDRFSQKFSDFTTPEYAKYDKITPKKWESCRGLGFSFGYNRAEGPEHVLSGDKLIELFVDIVSKNGNLLLNIGPRHDGTISELQVSRLKMLGEWLQVNGEGIFESRPWTRPSAKTEDGADLRFTRKRDSLYVFMLARPKGETLVIPDTKVAANAKIIQLGGRDDLKWMQKEGALAVSLPKTEAGYASVLKVTPAPVSAA